MGFWSNVFGTEGEKKDEETIFSDEEFITLELENKKLAEEEQKKIELESEFQKFSDGIDDFFYEKLVVELDEEILNNFTIFCIEKINVIDDPNPKKKKIIWSMIRKYVLDMYKKERNEDIVIFLNSVESRVLS